MSKKYYTLKALSAGEIEILIYEQIGSDFWSEGLGAKQFAEELRAYGNVSKITLRINSPGGSVFEGLAIYNTLKAHPAEKVCIIDGLAASIASVIAMCGKVVMPANALMMVHNPIGCQQGEADDMREMADLLDKIKGSIIAVYKEKCGMDEQAIAELMDDETWMSGDEAVQWGFADECIAAKRIAATARTDMFNHFKKTPNDLTKTSVQAAAPLEVNKTTSKEVVTMKCTTHGVDLIDGVCAACEAEKKIQNRTAEIMAIADQFKSQVPNAVALAMECLKAGKDEGEFKSLILNKLGEAKPVNVEVENLAAQKPFKCFGEQLKAVADAAKKPHMVDKRLLHINNAASGSAEGVPGDGGFLIQQDFSTSLLKLTHDTGILSAKCNRIPIGAGKNGLRAPIVDETSRATGSRWGGVQVYRVNEADDLSSKTGKPKFALVDLRLEKMAGVVYATEDLLEDATALEAIVMQAVPEEFAFMTDDEIMRGSGVGQCLGVLNSKAVVSVAKESNQTAGTVNVQNITKMVSRMYARGMAKAEWFINQDVLPQLYTLTLGNYPIYMPPGGASATPYGTLYGKPINVIEQAETVGTVGDIMLADFSQYLLIEKGGVDATQSVHVKFLTDEMTFKFIIRTNGQPMWKSAVTPYKGTNTISPFITLATRS